MNIILITALLIISTLTIILLSKYTKLKNKIIAMNSVINELKKPLRHGYYTKSINRTSITGAVTNFTSFVYVNELDRFTNGKSKIEIEHIEPGINDALVNNDSVVKFINNEFISIIDTSYIEWLESEVQIKEMRKNKLNRLQEFIKKS
jgi:hypothetical protein